MFVIGILIVGFGIVLIVMRKSARKSILRKAEKIGSPMISKSVNSDGARRIVEVGVVFIAIGVWVILEALGVL
ncbi:hypothetical protein [Microbacterium sp. Mcb102]|uniref:hypothetical protein n=1 Tax=Microbacterium sp. Mcb102 TaxID=2926012 RepID=UPI0021C600A3|nr:hypothetical protein [Microbacterium sp. Mcb102]